MLERIATIELVFPVLITGCGRALPTMRRQASNEFLEQMGVGYAH